MSDVHFPVIHYSASSTSRVRGRQHGETFRAAIKELAAIRRDLMIQKNPALNSRVMAALASEQWTETERFDAEIADEISGIAEGAKVSIEHIIILNNYTDFRDIQVTEQGCSVIYVNKDHPLAGQTWDMHSTAKN